MPCLSDGAVAQARGDKECRKHVMQLYRDQVLRPALMAYDAAAYKEAVQHRIVLGTPYLSLHPVLTNSCPALMDLPLKCQVAHWARIWSSIRSTGRFPMLLFGGSGFSTTLEKCSLCNTPNIDVDHVLCYCPGTLPQYMQLARFTAVPSRTKKKEFASCIFGSSALACDRLYHMMYVSKAMQTTLSLSEATEKDIEDLVDEAFRAACDEYSVLPPTCPKWGSNEDA